MHMYMCTVLAYAAHVLLRRDVGRGAHPLRQRELPVQAARLPHELLVAPVRDEPAAVEDENAVAVGDGAEPSLAFGVHEGSR